MLIAYSRLIPTIAFYGIENCSAIGKRRYYFYLKVGHGEILVINDTMGQSTELDSTKSGLMKNLGRPTVELKKMRYNSSIRQEPVETGLHTPSQNKVLMGMPGMWLLANRCCTKIAMSDVLRPPSSVWGPINFGVLYVRCQQVAYLSTFHTAMLAAIVASMSPSLKILRSIGPVCQQNVLSCRRSPGISAGEEASAEVRSVSPTLLGTWEPCHWPLAARHLFIPWDVIENPDIPVSAQNRWG